MPGSRVGEEGFATEPRIWVELIQHGILGKGEKGKEVGREYGHRCGVENDCGPFDSLTLVCGAVERDLLRALDDRTPSIRPRSCHFIFQAGCLQGRDVCVPQGYSQADPQR